MGSRTMSSSSSFVHSDVIQWCTKCIAADAATSVDNAASAFAENANANLGFQVTAIFAVALGALLCFFGWSLFHITLAITGALIGLGAGFALLCGSTGSIIFAGIAGALCGLLMASAILKLEKLGVF